MVDFWYATTAFLFAMYAMLAGFDLGAGALHIFVAQTDAERRAVLSAVGPFWHGNEVWLLAAAGTLLLAFPAALAATLSGFYLGIVFAVWALMLRAAAIELRNHAPSDLWHTFWDAVLSLTSATYVLLFGILVGNVIRGVPFDAHGDFTLPLFGAPAGLVDAYTASAGVFALVCFATHGATFLAWKTDARAPSQPGPRSRAPSEPARGPRSRAEQFARTLWPVTLACWGALIAATHFAVHFGPRGAGWALVAIAGAAGVTASTLVRRNEMRAAFIASCTFLAATAASMAASLHPVLVRALPNNGGDLSAAHAAANETGLKTAVWWWCLAAVLAVLYAANTFRHQRGKAG